MFVTVSAVLLASVLQAFILKALRPRGLVGDEVDYATASEGKTAALWIRVPLHRAMIRTALATMNRGDCTPARLLVSLQSLAAIALTVGYAEWHWGPWVALIPAITQVFSVERLILAMHLWPDIAIGLLWLCALLLIDTPAPGSFALLAVTGAIALGLRIEGAALCLVAVIAPLASGNLAAAIIAALICAAFTIGYMAWNTRLHGRWVLDSTTSFNLSVMKIDASAPQNSISQTMQQAIASTRSDDPPLLPVPSARVQASRLAARLKTLFGRESFVSQVLLNSGQPDYDQTALARIPSWAKANLGYWTTAGILLTLTGLPWVAPAHAATFLFACLVYSALLVRSRYRMALLPMMALIMAEAAANLRTVPSLAELVVGLALLVGFVLVLVFASRQEERP